MFDYDRYGNRTSLNQFIGSLNLNTTPAISESSNRFTSTDFGYDNNGNVIADIDQVSNLPRQFIFNGDNKQSEVKRDGVTIGRYFYDGEGKRIKKVTDTETTVFVYSSGKLIAEYSTQISQTPSVAYTTTDHLGTPRIITDELGQVKARRDFMPFGEELYVNVGGRSTNLNYGTSEDDIRQKFTGYQKDKETGLDFAEARMYANNFGRFTAVDPLTASGKSSHPQTFNRYIYVGNDPINLRDPDGLQWYVAFEVQRVNGKLRTVAVSPQWIGGNRKYGRRQWGTPGTFTEEGRRVSYDAKWVFFDPYHKKYAAVDQWEPRDPGKHMFDSMEAAQNQIGQWNRQAAVNFMAGMANSMSLAVSVSGADGVVAETNSNMYAIGQRAGHGANIAGTVTGVGLINGLVNKFGRAGISIFKGLEVTGGALSQFTHAGKFGFGSYDSLRGAVISTFGKGSGLQVHHLIEKRFAGVLGERAGEMTSIVLTRGEHEAFTAAWRREIGHVTDNVPITTANATVSQIQDAARRVYANHPEILRALGL